MLVAVREEDHRAPAVTLLETIGVELRLLLADSRVLACPLRLDQPQRSAVVAPQHVIDESGTVVPAVLRRHPAHFELDVVPPAERPTCLLQQQVNEVVA